MYIVGRSTEWQVSRGEKRRVIASCAGKVELQSFVLGMRTLGLIIDFTVRSLPRMLH